MHELPLTGLYASNPLGALAAFGLLRALCEVEGFANARLAWRETDDWQALLFTPEMVTQEQLIEVLSLRQKGLDLSLFSWSEDIRVQTEDFRKRLQQHAATASVMNRTLADYFTAFGSELATDDTSKGLVKPTAFHMTSARQLFLKILLEVGEGLRRNSQPALREALFGPWRYEDEKHSLGWDPSTERLAALRHMAPGDETPRSVRAAVWLAAEALPLFPTAVVDSPRSVRLKTTGFSRHGEEWMFRWPVWQTPIALLTLKSLLASPWLHDERLNSKNISRRGVVAVFESAQYRFGKGYGIFRPASQVFLAS